MIPEFPKFKEIEIKDKETYQKFLEKDPKNICEFSFTNLIVWKEFDRPRLTMINDNLCVLISPVIEKPYFLEPIGGNKLLETIEICLKHIGKISRTSANLIKITPKKTHRCLCLRGQFDYVYETQELAELKGKKFDGKRNHIKRFKEKYPNYKYLPCDPKLKKEALALFEKWFAPKKDSKFYPKLAYTAQKQALEIAFSNFEELNLFGGAIFLEDSLKGFMIGSKLNNDMLDAHFQYTDPETQGTSQLLLQEACQKTFSAFKYINLEQDLGIPGLRKSKLSWHPYKLEKKFEIIPLKV